jgi:hypothetical protein
MFCRYSTATKSGVNPGMETYINIKQPAFDFLVRFLDF